MNKSLAQLRSFLWLRIAGVVGMLLPVCLAAAAPIGAGTATQLSTERPNKNREALVFRNGDLLYGALDSFRPESGVRWRHFDVEDVIQFKPDNIAEIHFPMRPRKAGGSPSACRLQLSNGDELEGNLVVFDSDKALLETWYAGEVTVPRKVIRSIVPLLPDGAVVFEGPTGLEGWTIGKVVSALGDAGEWKYRNGAFYATNAASIARDLKLPDMSVIEFDLAWKGVFQLAIAIYTDYMQPINLANKETEPAFAGFYSLQLNSFSANLLPVKKNDPLRYLGQVSVPAFNQKNTAHVEIRSNKAKRSVTLLVDGQVIKHWIDTEDFAGEGGGIRLVHQGQGKVRVTNLRVTEWNGQSDEQRPVAADPKQDIARLRNGDKVVGQIASIQDAKAIVSMAGTELSIPLSRVHQIDLASANLEKASGSPGSVRAIFNRGGAVTFQLVEWANGKVLGASPNFGELVFDATAFSRLELPKP